MALLRAIESTTRSNTAAVSAPQRRKPDVKVLLVEGDWCPGEQSDGDSITRPIDANGLRRTIYVMGRFKTKDRSSELVKLR